jgi:hypothetical protein
MSKAWRSGPGSGGRIGLTVEAFLGEYRISNGSGYVGSPVGERDARLSRLERILIAVDAVPGTDSTGAFVWSSRAAAEAAINRA